MAAKDYIGYLSTLLKEQEEERSEFATRVRQEVIVPFCEKHGFVYEQNLGCYYFCTPDYDEAKAVHDEESLNASTFPDEVKVELCDMLALLKMSETTHFYLGMHVDSFNEEAS